MTASQCTSPEDFLLTRFPAAELRSKAMELGCVQRLRRLDILSLILVVVLTVSGKGQQPIAGMRRALERKLKLRLASSSFWARLSPAFGRLVSWMLSELMVRSRESPILLKGFLSGFTEVLAVDATVVQVHKSLASKWKGTGSDAAVKIHTFVRALTGELLRYRITAEARSECRVFGVGSWARGALFLLDRGYSSAVLWYRIHRLGGFFVTRLKKNFHAEIESVNPGHRGSKSKAIGARIKDLMSGRRGGRIDVMCRFSVRLQPYGGKSGRRFHHNFRVVAVWNKGAQRYHIYVTNVGSERLKAEHIAALYRLRWTVERFYLAAKSGMGLDKITSRKPHIVETLIRAALLRTTLAMQARLQAEQKLPPGRWINPLLWVQIWRERIGTMLNGWPKDRPCAESTEWKRMALLAMDPNRKRRSPVVLARMGIAPQWPFW